MKDIRIVVSNDQHASLLRLADRMKCRKLKGGGDVGMLIRAIADGFVRVEGAGGKVSAQADPQQPAQESKAWRWNACPPRWWDVESGLMELKVIEKKTGVGRKDLIADGWKCTATMARAPWPTYGPAVPDWWVDRDDEPGMVLDDVPGGEKAAIEAGCLVMGGLVVLPDGPAEKSERKADKKLEKKKAARKK